MTSENLITAPVGTTLEEAKKILGKARKRSFLSLMMIIN